MLFKYFTVQTANEVLPAVIQKYENIKKQKMEVIKAEQQLQITLSDNNTFEEYVVLKQKLNEELSKFYKTIEELEATGVVMKGLDQGLLDFPSKRFDEEVSTLKESKRLYKTIQNELGSRKPINESIDNKINKEVKTGISKQLNESTAYIDRETSRIIGLMKRVENK